MKKLFSIFTMIICAIAFYACTEKDTFDASQNEKQKYSYEYEVLQRNLIQYNEKYAPPKYIESRRGGFWRRLCGIFGADGMGAVVGSTLGPVGTILGGIGNSLLFAALGDEFLCNEMHVRIFEISPDSIIPITYASFPISRTDPIPMPLKTFPELNEEITNPNPSVLLYEGVRTITLHKNRIGNLHNKIIADLYKEDNDLLNHSISTLINETAGSLEKEGYEVTNEIKQNIINLTNKDMSECEDLESTTIKFQYYYPEYTEIFRIIEDFVQNASSCTSEAQLYEYANGYLNVVNNSNLPTENKNIIVSALDIAANSILLWCIE